MPTSQTVLSVYNLTLDLVQETPALSLIETRPEVKWLNRNFDHTRQMMLRANPWNFACELFELNAAADVPAYQWRYFYDLPNGWLRVLPPTYNGERNGVPLNHVVKSNRLLMNDTSPRRVELVMDQPEPGTWDALFLEAFRCTLAAQMAHRFSGKAKYLELARGMAREAMDKAEEINAFEGSIAAVEQHDIIRVRSL